MDSSGSVFSRRPSLFRKTRHRHKTSLLPPAVDAHHHDDDQQQQQQHQHQQHQQQQQHHHPEHAHRHSISAAVGDLGLQLRRSRSSSLRSAASSHARQRSTSTMHSLSLSLSVSPVPDKPEKPSAPAPVPRPALSTFARPKQKPADLDRPALDRAALDRLALDRPAPDKHAPMAPAAPPVASAGPNPHLVFHHIHELASKRISTLDYLRKAHEGRIYWFNTLLFSKSDLSRLPSSAPRPQSRRATHYLLLGFSLPTILDLHATSPLDYLRALNALLLEFEQYQSMHPADGSAPSLSRARIPHMFKRANLAGKSRRSSSATADFPLLTSQSSTSISTGPTSSSSSTFSSSSFPSSSSSDPTSLTSLLDPAPDDLNPGESYTYLQTPSLPFDPDFYSTFASLCDVLIDCYAKMLAMLSTPESVAAAGHGVPATVGDLFAKADARVRKILLAGMVREFEESCRVGVRGEVGGVGKVVLGGLM